MKRYLLLWLLVLGVTLAAPAQSGWVANRAYLVAGVSQTFCGEPFSRWRTDSTGSRQVYYQSCRSAVWHQEFGQRDVYFWNPTIGNWMYTNQQGYYWIFQWEDRVVRVR